MLAEMDKDKNGFTQRILSTFYNHPNGFVSTMLVGNNVVLVIYGILIAAFFDHTIFRGLDAAFTVTADTLLSTLIILFTGEFLPKTLFKSTPTVCSQCSRPWPTSSMSCSGPSASFAPWSPLAS